MQSGQHSWTSITCSGFAICSIFGLAMAMLATPAHALVVKTWDGVGTPASPNVTAPTDDPGWANLADNRTGIYLGDGTVITAKHAEGVGTIRFGGQSYNLINNTLVTLRNDNTFGVRRQSNGSLETFSDLWVYKIRPNAETGLLPEEFDPNIRKIKIADRLPGYNSETLTMFGRGATRVINTANTENGQTYYNSTGGVLSDPDDWDSSSYRGFPATAIPASGDRVWQWGTNQRSTSDGPAYTSGGNTLIENVFGTDTIGFATRFDENGLDDEAQGVGGDSGGPVFWKDGDEWVLAGLLHAIFPARNGTNSLNSAFGAHSLISDLSHDFYADQIAEQRSRFSLMGDINLDGSITGEIINGEATGDLGILVDNWLSSSPEASIHTWMQGDLNLDGSVGLADFVLMRDALGGSISSTAFAALVSGPVIPEPASLSLFVAAIAFGLRRRR
ncbi:MAG: PEP-CTERM sorting domain-containing protein [Planctomycetota bacterium]